MRPSTKTTPVRTRGSRCAPSPAAPAPATCPPRRSPCAPAPGRCAPPAAADPRRACPRTARGTPPPRLPGPPAASAVPPREPTCLTSAARSPRRRGRRGRLPHQPTSSWTRRPRDAPTLARAVAGALRLDRRRGVRGRPQRAVRPGRSARLLRPVPAAPVTDAIHLHGSACPGAMGIRPTKLPDVCRRLGIPLLHHDAASDATACARIVLAAEAEGWRPRRRTVRSRTRIRGEAGSARSRTSQMRAAPRPHERDSARPESGAMILIGDDPPPPKRPRWRAVALTLQAWWKRLRKAIRQAGR